MLTVRTIDLGRMPYRDCWEYQQRLFDVLTARRGDASDEAGWLLTVEHPPVYTLGKSGKAQNLLVGEEFLRAKGAEYYHIDRGGDITFHGPGQAVCYPILDLARLGIGLREYIFRLEESVIEVVGRYGIRGARIAGASGRLDRRRGRRAAQDLRNRRPRIAFCYHARLRPQRLDRLGVVRPDQSLRIRRQGRDLDRTRDGAHGADGRSEEIDCNRFKREIRC